jgi:hypothetical protein
VQPWGVEELPGLGGHHRETVNLWGVEELPGLGLGAGDGQLSKACGRADKASLADLRGCRGGSLLHRRRDAVGQLFNGVTDLQKRARVGVSFTVGGRRRSSSSTELLNYDPNSLKLAKLANEAEARRREAWARAKRGQLAFGPLWGRPGVQGWSPRGMD